MENKNLTDLINQLKICKSFKKGDFINMGFSTQDLVCFLDFYFKDGLFYFEIIDGKMLEQTEYYNAEDFVNLKIYKENNTNEITNFIQRCELDLDYYTRRYENLLEFYKNLKI